jgi:hypothetical protein
MCKLVGLLLYLPNIPTAELMSGLVHVAKYCIPDLGVQTDVVDIMGDNQSTLAVISNPISSDKTKHMDTIHH